MDTPTTAQAVKHMTDSGQHVAMVIIDQFGTMTMQVYGGLGPGQHYLYLGPPPAAETPPEPEVKPRKPNYASAYKPTLEAMKEGSEGSIPIPLDADPSSFQASVGSWCNEHWGRGRYKTAIVNSVVRVFYLLPQRQIERATP